MLELENDGYGEEIARLEAAAAAVEVPSKMLRDVPNDVVEQFNAVKARIQRRLPKAVKENDTIYIQVRRLALRVCGCECCRAHATHTPTHVRL